MKYSPKVLGSIYKEIIIPTTSSIIISEGSSSFKCLDTILDAYIPRKNNR